MNGHKIVNQNALHFVTSTVVSWIDIFTRKRYKDILIESLDYCCKEKGLVVYGYVIMTNHMHLIIKAKDGYQLSEIIRDFKRHTSKTITHEIIESNIESRKTWILQAFKFHALKSKNNSHFQLWQKGFHPIELFSPKWIMRRLNYIHNNPVVAGIVDKAEDYVYSSARNYMDHEDVKLDVGLIDFNNLVGYVFIG